LKCDVQRDVIDGRPQVCNPYTGNQYSNNKTINHTLITDGRGNYTDKDNATSPESSSSLLPLPPMLSTTSIFNATTNTTQYSGRGSMVQCLCLEGVECYTGRMCEQCAYGYVRTGVKECKFCAIKPIPSIQFAGFVVLLLILLTVFIKVTVKSAGSSSPSGSMKKIVINFLQLESLALGFPLQWPPIVTSMFAGMGVTSSASADVFVIECIFPRSSFTALPAVYQKTIMVVLLPIFFMLACGAAWFVHDHLCAAKVKPMKHTPVPKILYEKHQKHNAETCKRQKLEKELRDFQEHDDIPDELQFSKDGDRDNDSVEDFGFVYRQAIQVAEAHGIDVEASFQYFTSLQNDEEISEKELLKSKIQNTQLLVTPEAKAEQQCTVLVTGNGVAVASVVATSKVAKTSKKKKEKEDEDEGEMSTAAFEHMLHEWKASIKDDNLLWSMLSRVDTDASGWISIEELRAFERGVLFLLFLLLLLLLLLVLVGSGWFCCF